ncbi:hypothetical protein HBB16_06075 [Pseudonocardia sp. MCCB 268]|nr:hypothetical protein [Pseudonocardia cytotoxica]
MRDDVGLPGTRAIAFRLAFTFDDDAPGSVLVVPAGGRRAAWPPGVDHRITTARRTPAADAVLPAPSPVGPAAGLRFAVGDVPAHRYRSAVAEAVRRMRASELEKIVLAHDLLARADTPSTRGSCCTAWRSGTRPAGASPSTGWWGDPGAAAWLGWWTVRSQVLAPGPRGRAQGVR